MPPTGQYIGIGLIYVTIREKIMRLLYILIAAPLGFLASGCTPVDPKVSTNFPYCAPACVWVNNDGQTITPIIYKDPKTHAFIYVESDGRHVTAFSSEGTLLWQRNPFEDAHLWPYRVSKPIIVHIEEFPESNELSVQFNSSQFGSLNKTTGEFTFGGQN